MNFFNWFGLIAFILLLFFLSYQLIFSKNNFQNLFLNAGRNRLAFPRTAREVNVLVNYALEKAEYTISDILYKKNFESIKFFDWLISQSDAAIAAHICSILEMVSPNESVRQAAHEGAKKINEFYVDNVYQNKLLYDQIAQYAKEQAPLESLSSTQRYMLQQIIDDFKRNGLELPEEKRNEVKKIQKELHDLSLQFDRNIAQDNTIVFIKKEALNGCDDSCVGKLKETPDGLLEVTLDYPTLNHVLENCTVEETRKKIYTAFNNRGYPINDALLKKIIVKRDQLAKLLGFENYATLDLDDQMVKTTEKAHAFLDELIAKSNPKALKEINKLTAILPKSVTLSKEEKIKPWDLRFLENQYKKHQQAIDEQLISQYFPMKSTIDGLLAIYKQFFSIEFELIPVKSTWHEDVQLLKVTDLQKTETIGYLYLDLYPRPNKYSHACHATIVPGILFTSSNQELKNNKRTPTTSLVIANFPKTTDKYPSLLTRNDVKTFFHEFGHALHAVFGASELGAFAGTSVKRDFVEMPSQMLEEWLWNKNILKKISCHHKTGEPLPDTIIDTIIAHKQDDAGLFIQTQAFYAKLSLHMFDNNVNKDPYELMKQLYEKYRSILFDPQNHMYCSFGHLIGYGAKYYGYLWSKVFALDLFETIKQHGLLDASIGKSYRDIVLAPGGSKDPALLLEEFLGRAPSENPFIRDLGIEVDKPVV